jgi:hypothetical protein
MQARSTVDGRQSTVETRGDERRREETHDDSIVSFSRLSTVD